MTSLTVYDGANSCLRTNCLGRNLKLKLLPELDYGNLVNVVIVIERGCILLLLPGDLPSQRHQLLFYSLLDIEVVILAGRICA